MSCSLALGMNFMYFQQISQQRHPTMTTNRDEDHGSRARRADPLGYAVYHRSAGLRAASRCGPA
jgi:hypothetical protein